MDATELKAELIRLLRDDPEFRAALLEAVRGDISSGKAGVAIDQRVRSQPGWITRTPHERATK